MAKTRVGVLISGRGSNMAALIAAARAENYPAEIALVIANKAEAAGLAHARAEGVPTVVVDHRPFGTDRAAFDAALEAELQRHAIALICLAGFMRILTDGFVQRWHGRMLNIHPSLLPAFRGLHPHAQALAAGTKLAGATVHFVTPEMDSGPIVAQAAVAVHEADTAETLAERVLAVEHRLYPHALALVAAGRVRIADGRCLIDGTRPVQASLLVPND